MWLLFRVIQPKVMIFDKEMIDYVDFVADKKDVEIMVESKNGQYQMWCRVPLALNEVCDHAIFLHNFHPKTKLWFEFEFFYFIGRFAVGATKF